VLDIRFNKVGVAATADGEGVGPHRELELVLRSTVTRGKKATKSIRVIDSYYWGMIRKWRETTGT